MALTTRRSPHRISHEELIVTNTRKRINSFTSFKLVHAIANVLLASPANWRIMSAHHFNEGIARSVAMAPSDDQGAIKAVAHSEVDPILSKASRNPAI